MNKKIIIGIFIVGLILLGGCDGYTQEEVVALCNSQYYKGYEMGKIIGESCNEEVKLDIYKRAKEGYLEESIYNFRQDCLLIITNRKRPEQNEWYNGMGFEQFDKENMFPIRTWNLTSDQIEGEDFDGWNYWVICK